MRTLTARLRELIETRPLCCICALFMALTAPVLFLPAAGKIALFALFLAAAVLLLVTRRRIVRFTLPFLRAAVCLCVGAAVCAVTFIAYDLSAKRTVDLAKTNEPVKIAVVLEKEVYSSSFGSLYEARLKRIGERGAFGARTLVSFDRESAPLFTVLEGEAVFRDLESSSAYVDYTNNYRANAIFTEVDGNALTVKSETDRGISFLSHELREAIGERFEKMMSPEGAALAKALLLGERKDLSSEIKRDFRTLGISHLLAISGMHLSILFFLFDALLRRVRLPFIPRTVLLFGIVVSYMALCGFSPSVTRAGLMLLIMLTARLFGRTSDPVTTLFLSGAVILFFSPYTAFSVAFMLSFLSVFGILLFETVRRRNASGAQTPVRRLLSSVGVAFATQIAILPVVAFTYRTVALPAPLFSLLFSPLIALILYLAPVFLLLSFIPYVGPLFMATLSAVCNFTTRASSIAHCFKDLTVPVDPTAFCLFALPALILTVLLILSERKRRPAAAILALYILFGAASWVLPRLAKARIITDVSGQNDIVLAYAGGKCTLIDLSDGSLKYAREACALLGVETGASPCEIVFTHYHRKHLSAFEYYCKSGYPELLCLPEPSAEETDTYSGLLRRAKEAGVKVVTYAEGDAVSLPGGIDFTPILKERIKRSTHPVFAFALSSQARSVTFLSSSAWEVCTPAGDAVCFLKHGPVAKTPPSTVDAPLLIVRNGNIEEYCRKQTAECLVPTGRYTIFFDELG
ncbi:MAG: ComEC/Rec2 family competence protein [Clostridia bacterium]|nr:ComEC/Rec2 family competence protein [Clostridia bacterium]